MTARRVTLAGIGLGLVGIVTLASVTPPIALLAAGAIADAYGCVLDEGSVHPCVVAGHDLGGALYTAFVGGGWLSVLSAPVMLAAAAFWIGYGVRRLLHRRARGPVG